VEVVVQNLNQRADQIAAQAIAHSNSLRIQVVDMQGLQVLDFGVAVEGGLAAGVLLARMCMAGLADVSVTDGDSLMPELPRVLVRTDHPLEACLLSQYAGWKVATEDYFAMASGPMRCVARQEPLFDEFATQETGNTAIGVLESGALPTDGAIEFLKRGVRDASSVTVAVAPTASQSGTIQVVARSLETAMHKLHELKFPVSAIVSGTGISPLPPVAADDLNGIGRTNDAILYGATVNLWVRCEDKVIEDIGPQVPSSASPSCGQTFLTLFEAAGRDFYGMDKALFSPAVVVFNNLQTGRSFVFGETNRDLLCASFGI